MARVSTPPPKPPPAALRDLYGDDYEAAGWVMFDRLRLLHRVYRRSARAYLRASVSLAFVTGLGLGWAVALGGIALGRWLR